MISNYLFNGINWFVRGGMRKIIIFIFLILTLLCSCSEEDKTATDRIDKEKALSDGKKYANPMKDIEYLKNVIKLQPNNASMYNNRGTAYYNLGQYQHAIQDYSAAIRLKPDYSLAYYNRGCVYIKNPDQYKQAIEDLNKAIHLKPDYVEAYNNLGGIYLIQGRRSIGCSNAQKACELGNCKLLEMAKSKGYCRWFGEGL